MRLRTFLLALVLASMVPLLLVALATTWWVGVAERARERDQLVHAAAAAASAIEVALRERVTLARAFATQISPFAGDRAAIVEAARSVHGATGIHLVVATPEGVQISNTTVPRDMVAGLPSVASGARRALAASAPELSDIISRPRDGTDLASVLWAAKPEGSEPVPFGVLVEPRELADILPRPSSDPSSFAAVFDSSGRMAGLAIGSPEAARQLRLEPAADGRLRVAGPGATDLVTEIAPVDDRGWNVAVGVPVAAFGSTAERALAVLALAGIGGLCLAAVFATLLASFLLRESRTLVRAAAGVVEPGGVLPRSPLRELAILRDAIEQAAKAVRERAEALARLKASRDAAETLEREVTERTRDLEETMGRLLNAKDDERRRIARELHDSTVQELHAAALSVTAAQRLIRAGRVDDSDNPLADARTALDRAREELRTVAFILQPPLLDECGLPTALRVYAEGFGRRAGLQITMTEDGWPDAAPRQVETMLFRVAQEALANAHRHAHAKAVSVALKARDGTAILEVTDDGRGIHQTEEPRTPNLGVGIPGMRARLRQLGGHLSLRSDPAGTRLVAVVPFSDAATPGKTNAVSSPLLDVDR